MPEAEKDSNVLLSVEKIDSSPATGLSTGGGDGVVVQDVTDHPLRQQTEKNALSSAIQAVNQTNNQQTVKPSSRYARTDNPTPIALEPCNRNRAAVLSLILRLPTGGTGEVPIGQTGIAIASALVSLGPGAQKMSKNNSGSRKANASNETNSPVFL